MPTDAGREFRWAAPSIFSPREWPICSWATRKRQPCLKLRSADCACDSTMSGPSAWCGGTSQARIAEAKFPAGRPAIVRPGEELEFDPSERGGRAWIAIAGGIDVPLVLGSRSTDLRSGFGGFEGRTLRDDDVLPLGKTAQGKADARLANWSAPVDWAQTATTQLRSCGLSREVSGMNLSRKRRQLS